MILGPAVMMSRYELPDDCMKAAAASASHECRCRIPPKVRRGRFTAATYFGYRRPGFDTVSFNSFTLARIGWLIEGRHASAARLLIAAFSSLRAGGQADGYVMAGRQLFWRYWQDTEYWRFSMAAFRADG